MNPLVIVVVAQLLPAGGLVRGPTADPREPINAIGFINTTIFADPLAARPGQSISDPDLNRDAQGVAQAGINFGIVRFSSITLSLQSGVVSRFRLEPHDNDEFSIDYQVSLPFNYQRGNYEARVRLMHRSSHLGDEIILNEGLRRLEFDHEEIDAMIARKFGSIRAYAGATKTLATSFDADDRYGFQLGVEGSRSVSRNLKAVGAIDWQRHTMWRGSAEVSAITGFEYGGPGGKASLQFMYLTGATPVGELFYDRETYWGIRIVLEPNISNLR